ncbi:MAG: transglutaminase family protein [Rhodobacteraceae bacterium]|nr:transglutaminase family protein [Paracoccaceae bacterium]
MLLRIAHTTSYQYEAPVPYVLQQLRLRPKSRTNQNVRSWDIRVDGGVKELCYEDEHANTVDLISFQPGVTETAVHCTGEVEVTDNNGIVGRHNGFVPLWLYQRSTALTRVGAQMRALLHALSAHILGVLPYSTEQADPSLTAEQVLALGKGVCQDHAHVFIAAARHIGFPARYVSGYLMMNEQVEQNASHAWAEVHVDTLGWIGFDVSNGQSPDARYVRVATGLDYTGAAPVSGMRFGGGDDRENMMVTLRVEQQ